MLRATAQRARAVKGYSSDNPVREPLVIVELPLAVVVVALTDQVQAESNRLALVQVRHQALTAEQRPDEGGFTEKK